MSDKHVCPWWLAYTFDNPLRRFLHDPEAILSPYLRSGMTAADLGCGMGFFSRGMARIVGDAGKVIAVDLQQEMLDITRKRAERDGIVHRVSFQRAKEDDLTINEQVDFALAFWMAHEVNDEARFFEQVFSVLKPAGVFLIAEPRMHVTKSRFEELLKFAENAGFKISAYPRIRISRAAAFTK